MLFQKSCCSFVLLLVALSIASALGESGGDKPEVSGDQPKKEEPGRHPNGYHREENKLNSIVRCNYTSEGPRSCASCKNLLLCSHFNVGVLAPCVGKRNHCNDGHCSETPSAKCNSTSDERHFQRWSIFHLG
ncbi:unnamed protein product, partial [Iphiclides podalirius]